MVAHALRRPGTVSDVHQFAAHSFKSLDSAHFSPLEYSKLKFGCERVARLYGTDLAQAFFNTHKEQLKTNPIVVHSSTAIAKETEGRLLLHVAATRCSM